MRNSISLLAGMVLVVSSVLPVEAHATSPAEPASVIPALPAPGLDNRQPVAFSSTQFINSAVLLGLSEQAFSRVALERSRNLRVNLLADRVIKGQLKIISALEIIATREKIEVPEKLGAEGQASLSSLKLQPAEKFDTAYVLQMRESNTRSVALFEKAKSSAAIDSSVRELADKSLTALRDLGQHLQELDVPVKVVKVVVSNPSR